MLSHETHAYLSSLILSVLYTRDLLCYVATYPPHPPKELLGKKIINWMQSSRRMKYKCTMLSGFNVIWFYGFSSIWISWATPSAGSQNNIFIFICLTLNHDVNYKLGHRREKLQTFDESSIFTGGCSLDCWNLRKNIWEKIFKRFWLKEKRCVKCPFSWHEKHPFSF